MFRISHSDLSVVTASEMQIRSDQRYHQRVAPASSLSVKHASRHICKQLTGPFPAALFLRGLEGWHAEADLIVPRLSLNLHVRCQLPCHRHSIAPPPDLTPNTMHALFKAVTSNLGKREGKEGGAGIKARKEKGKATRRSERTSLCRTAQQEKAQLIPIQVFNSLIANSWPVRLCQKVADEDKLEILKTTNFSPNTVMIFHL